MPIPEELKKRIEANIKQAEEAQEIAKGIITFAAKAGIPVGERPRELDKAIARIARVKSALEKE